ncbi:MAG: major capsid protein [Burkholderiales bacterium]
MALLFTPYNLHQIFDTILSDRDEPIPNQLQSHFGRSVFFESQTLDLDQVFPDMRISQFVAPSMQADPHTLRAHKTKIYYPTYWKEKATVDINNLRTRLPGEQIGAPITTAGKLASAITQNMMAISDKRTRLMEWTAAQIMLYGAYTASSAKHPAILVDLEPNIATHLTTGGTATATVPAAQAVALNSHRVNRANISGTDVTSPSTGQVIPTLGTNRAWGAASGTPVLDLEEMLEACWEEIGIIYMSTNAYAEFQKDPLFSKVVAQFLVPASTITLDFAPGQTPKAGLRVRGRLNGSGIPIVTYTAQYQPISSTTLAKFIPDGWVVGMPAASYGVTAFSIIEHAGADYGAQEIFWNSWQDEEFGKPWIQAQSAPLMIHTKINSTFAWKVM